MPDTWPGMLRAVLDSPRMWAAAFACALLGAITFLARRYGFIDDIPPSFYYAAVGLGLGSGLFIVTTAVQNATARVGVRLAAAREQKQLDEFSRKNFSLAGTYDREILLYYKRINQQRFRAVGPNEHLSGMVRQALIDRDSLDFGTYVQHYKVPDVIWKLLDNPPPGWADNVKKIDKVGWE